MTTNIGMADKAIRLIAAALVVILYLTGFISGTSGVLLLVMAGILALTGSVAFCPLYVVFGLSTCPAKKKKATRQTSSLR